MVKEDSLGPATPPVESELEMEGRSTKKRRTWQHLNNRIRITGAKLRMGGELIDSLDGALKLKGRGGALFYILAAAFQYIWRDRNKRVFQNSDQRTPLREILRTAKWEMEAFTSRRVSEERAASVNTALRELELLINEDHSDEQVTQNPNSDHFAPPSGRNSTTQIPPSHDLNPASTDQEEGSPPLEARPQGDELTSRRSDTRSGAEDENSNEHSSAILEALI
ncbi:hypothetical protein R1sor_002828 [Riccia sorocarpa]|uniref:Uncharacterized protein n=1 Tax=Riccia sorocarpa TaxID=122646 RepID=A0ABD3H425_9MARC